MKKAPRFIPAHEILHRVLWDGTLEPPECWIIGYLDRFDGVLEISLDEFMAIQEDEPEFAIPSHRIRYFKCNGTKVWDRESRTNTIDTHAVVADAAAAAT